MAYAPIQIANEFLRDHAHEGSIDPLKIQKLVYFANGWWLATQGRPLVSENPQVWRHGPVFRSLYSAFSRYQWRAIEGPAPGSPFGGNPLFVDGADREQVQALLRWIWEQYGQKAGTELSEETHAPGTPWQQIAAAQQFRVPANTDIPPQKDWEYFGALAKERGFQVAAYAGA